MVFADAVVVPGDGHSGAGAAGACIATGVPGGGGGNFQSYPKDGGTGLRKQGQIALTFAPRRAPVEGRAIPIRPAVKGQISLKFSLGSRGAIFFSSLK